MEEKIEKQIDDAVKSIFSPEMMDLLSDAVRNEKAIVRHATKAINEAIAFGCRDLDYMDQVLDGLWAGMDGMTGSGERTYRKYIKYLYTFDPIEAKDLEDSLEESLGYKAHAVYAAIQLAKEIHKGQVDKAGKDYFEGHLLHVGSNGFEWKEKVAGFLHDAAEDTEITVPQIIASLRKILQDWKKRVKDQPWSDLEEQYDIMPYPNEVMHLPTKEDWDEVAEILNLMNQHTAESREAYIERFRGHWHALKVKMNDLRHNMDLFRIPNPTDKDLTRVERYKKEYEKILQMFQELCDQRDADRVARGHKPLKI